MLDLGSFGVLDTQGRIAIKEKKSVATMAQWQLNI